jgi:DNA-binding NarL/FixJ family response regulator
MLAEARSPLFSVCHEKQLAPALQRLADEPFDALVSDLTLPDARGLEAVTLLQKQAGRVPVVVLTGLDDQELALEAVRQGAQDYLVKGQFDGDMLLRAVRYAIERKQIEEALTQARDELEQRVEERTAQLEVVNGALLTEIAERMRVEQALRDLNENLERRVLERTAELTEMNVQLVREIAERRQTESQLLRRNRELLALQTAIAATAASLELQFVLDTVTWEMANLQLNILHPSVNRRRWRPGLSICPVTS